MKHFLITGATGFIGRSYVQELQKENVKITLLSRPKSFQKTKKLFPDLDVIGVDLEQGINETFDMEKLQAVTDVVHVAGGYDIEMSFKNAYVSNILVSQNLIQLIKKIGQEKTIHLISSFSVVGNGKENLITEDDLCLDEKKMSNYSFSKAKVEECFRKNIESLNGHLRIYRPGIVVETRDGKRMEKIDGPYYFSSSLLKLKKLLKPMLFLCIPFSTKARLPLISIECLIKNLVLCTTQPTRESRIRSYFLFDENQYGVGELIKAFFDIVGIRAKIIPLPKINTFKNITKRFGIPHELYDFMFMNNQYDLSNRIDDFPNWHTEENNALEIARKILLSTPTKEQNYA